MEIELERVVNHAHDDFLHELDLGRWNDALDRLYKFGLALACFRLGEVHADDEQVFELQRWQFNTRTSCRVAQKLVFGKLAQRVLFAQSHQLAKPLSIFGDLGFYLSDSALGLGEGLLE